MPTGLHLKTTQEPPPEDVRGLHLDVHRESSLRLCFDAGAQQAGPGNCDRCSLEKLVGCQSRRPWSRG